MKTISYNLNQRLQYPDSAEAIAQLLARFRADIIFLQEVMVWREVAWLAHRLGFYCDRKAWTRGGYTVLSRAAPEAAWRCQVPGSAWGAGAAGMQVAGVWYLSTHLDDADYKRDEGQRVREASYILSRIPRGRVVLAGDFNSPSHLDVPGTYPSNLFRAWQDVQAGRAWSRSTWMPSRSFDRIDRIYSRGVTATRGGIVDHRDLGMPSWPTGRDHRMLVQHFKS